ncbi:hypothetical protein V1477_011339 [Vespula maculifrons]|uniref:Uncharacterized protein n=2 Tax=Vespula TaxID=7451 RepID=A0A834KDY0_VESVU|nr:hypothetical protein HZH66_003839 [Vespula vulgaris]
MGFDVVAGVRTGEVRDGRGDGRGERGGRGGGRDGGEGGRDGGGGRGGGWLDRWREKQFPRRFRSLTDAFAKVLRTFLARTTSSRNLAL